MQFTWVTHNLTLHKLPLFLHIFFFYDLIVCMSRTYHSLKFINVEPLCMNGLMNGSLPISFKLINIVPATFCRWNFFALIT